MRIIYMGTPDFALPALQTLYKDGHDIVAIYTQPPRRAGRGKKTRKSPIQCFGEDHGIEVRHPHKLKDNETEIFFMKAQQPDVIVVAAYGLLLPKTILEIPKFGALNIHASLLPRWRGASPIQQAIAAGDSQSGVTIMRMSERLDAGSIYKQKIVPLTKDVTAQSLHDTLAAISGPLLIDVLENWPAPIAQDESKVTYAPLLTRQDAQINWQENARLVDRKIRAYTPWPGAYTHTPQDVRLKIARTDVIDSHKVFALSGTVIDNHLTVACGEGALRLRRLQRPSKSMMDAQDFLKGYTLPEGTILQ